jgi:hypothetical protein
MQELSDEFRVETPEQAAWAMRKYRVLAQRRAQYEALAVAEQVRIEKWLERVSASVQTQMDYFTSHLEMYAMKQRLAGNKTVELPDGVIKTRSTGPTFDVDKAVFVEWAQEAKRDDVLRVRVEPDMTAIKGAFVADSGAAVDPMSGEVVPGLTAVPERVSVKIEADLDAIDLEGIDDADE